MLVAATSTSALVPVSGRDVVMSRKRWRFVRRICAVCGADAVCKHFGAMSCNACAAFFRRTVSTQQRFTCSHDSTCDISTQPESTSADVRIFCKFCRFKRCIHVGMVILSVQNICSPSDVQYEDPILRRITTAQRCTFLERFQSLIKWYGGQQASLRIAIRNPDCQHASIAVAAEITVLLNYMQTAGFDELLMNDTNLVRLGSSLFYTWVVFQTVMHNVRNAGYRTGLAFMIDESFMQLNESSFLDFIRTCTPLRNADICAKFAVDYFAEIRNAAKRIHSAHMDDAETAALFHICALRTAHRTFPNNPLISGQIQDLFKAMERRYAENYDDVAIRMGNLVLFVTEIERTVTVFLEYVTILDLNGFTPIVSRSQKNQMRLELQEVLN